jgi:DNA-directed RNA polymerase subunit RPC12/RpoP
MPTDAPPPIPTPDGPAVAKEPSLTKAPPKGKLFPCEKCGAKVEFDPRSRSLKCPYCGHETKVDYGDGEVEERNFNEYAARLVKGNVGKIEGRSTQTRCSGCGATVLLEDKVVTDRCPFCGTHLENKPEAVEGMLPPESLIPFRVDLRHARESFTKWLHGLWFAPTKLRVLALLGQLNGVYIPYWTYDAMTYTRYSGMRGDNYTTTETYTDRDSNGNMVTRTRTVVRTRWTHVSGEVQHFFDDVLVCGSKSVPTHLVRGMEPWNTGELEPFRDEFLAGLKTERYAVDLKDGLVIAKKMMEPTIHQLIREDIGGDHQQIHSTDTRYLGVTFKHCLLPVWVAHYRYHDKLFQILINGRTGKVSGERPYSWWKIGALVFAILVVVALIVSAVMTMQKGSGSAPAPAVPKRVAGSRRQAGPRPRAVRPPGEEDAVVEPARPPLPELERRRQHAVAAPVRRPRHVPVRVLRH